jgi:hypothetical protein
MNWLGHQHTERLKIMEEIGKNKVTETYHEQAEFVEVRLRYSLRPLIQ